MSTFLDFVFMSRIIRPRREEGGLEDGMQMHAFGSVEGNELWDGL